MRGYLERVLLTLRTAVYSLVGLGNVYFAVEDLSQYGRDCDMAECDQKASSQSPYGNTMDILVYNPLLHTWYLGVEEQFYLFFPWMLGCAHWRRLCDVSNSSNPMTRVYVLLGIPLVFSFLLQMHYAAVAPAYAFYTLPCRMWEVLVGVILCHGLVLGWPWGGPPTTSRKVNENPDSGNNPAEAEDYIKNNGESRRRPEDDVEEPRNLLFIFWLRQIGAVSLISYALWLFQFPSSFNNLFSTLNALAGTSLFIASGHGTDWSLPVVPSFCFDGKVPLLNYVFGRPFPAYCGRISYSLYLWHYPVNVFFAQSKASILLFLQLRFEESIIPVFALQITVMVFLSVFTHHLVENPFRFWRPAGDANISYLPAGICFFLLILMEWWLHGCIQQVEFSRG